MVRDAGEPEQERRGQRALVPGGEDDGGVERLRPDPLDERGGGVGVHRRGPVAAPGRGEDHHVVDAGQQPRRLLPRRRDQHGHAGVRGDGADGGSGEQDVSVAVRPDHQGLRHARPPSRRSAGPGRRRCRGPRRRRARPPISSARVTGVGTRIDRAPRPRRPPRPRRCRRSRRSLLGRDAERAGGARAPAGRGLAAVAAVVRGRAGRRPPRRRADQALSAALTASTSSAVSSPRAMPDWLVTRPTRTPAARSRVDRPAGAGDRPDQRRVAVVRTSCTSVPSRSKSTARGRVGPGRREPGRRRSPAAQPAPDAAGGIATVVASR